MRKPLLINMAVFGVVSISAPSFAQELSSSLYVTGDQFFADPFASETVGGGPGAQTDNRRLSRSIQASSFAAVAAPQPKRFAVHDLVTIIIREDTQTTFSSSLETEKESEWTGEIAEFPRFNLSDLVNLNLAPNTFPDGTVQVDITSESEFEGEGDYSNQQTLTARLQATIIDIRPNGNVVVEARKSVTSDTEHYTLVATGVCRVDDITVDNTVLSTQIADLFIDKQHEGHLKEAADKGLFTKIVDFLFPW